MTKKINRARVSVLALISFITVAAVTAQAAAPLPKTHVRGTITRVAATSVTVGTDHGAVTLELAPKTVIVQALPASVSDIKPNSFLGVTSIPSPGDAKAVGVLLLPDAFEPAGIERRARIAGPIVTLQTLVPRLVHRAPRVGCGSRPRLS